MTETLVPLPDGRPMRVHVEAPGFPGPHRGAIVLHEAYGLNDDIRAVCRRFAGRGWVAAAPDLFSAGRQIVCLARAMLEVSTFRAGAIADLVAVTETWLASRSDVDADRLAVIGFCMGGGFALLHACRQQRRVRAASVNYGDVPKTAAVLRGACPIVASYGGRDRLYGPKGWRLERMLEEAGVAHDVRVYPEAGHSFMTHSAEAHPVGRLLAFPLRSGHHPEAARDAWERTFAFLEAHVA